MAGSVTIKIEGYKELMQKFGGIMPKQMQDQVLQGVNKATVMVEGRAVSLAPVDTGDLRRKMGAEPAKVTDGKIEGKVYNTSDHAIYVEFGTGRRGNGSYPYPTDVTLAYKDDWAGMVAQPYLGRALHTSEKQITSIIKQSVKSAMKGL